MVIIINYKRLSQEAGLTLPLCYIACRYKLLHFVKKQGVTKNENPHYACDFAVTPTVTPENLGVTEVKNLQDASQKSVSTLDYKTYSWLCTFDFCLAVIYNNSKQ